MNNTEYLQSIGLNEGDKNYPRALDVMDGYGDNRWWLSDDPRVRGYYGLMEPVLLTSMSHFHEDVEVLVGRPVQTFEFATSYASGLKREAQEAWGM